MRCEKCGEVFTKKDNKATRINGEEITVCPNCGNEEKIKKTSKHR